MAKRLAIWDLPEAVRSHVTDRPSAEAWIKALHDAGLSYHFDDGAMNCLHYNGLVTATAARLIDRRVSQCYAAWRTSGADLQHDCPIGHCIKVHCEAEPAHEEFPDGSCMCGFKKARED